MKRSRKIELFRDYFDNFLTLATFAEHYGLTEMQAYSILRHGRTLHDVHAK